MIQFKSLATRTLLQMAVRIGCVILITCSIGYFHMMANTQNMIKDNVTRYMSERRDREKITFDTATENHQILAAEFLNLYSKYRQNPKTPLFFKELVKKFPDGALRNRDPRFDGKTQVGVFIGSSQRTDFDFQARVLAAYDVSNRMGLPYHGAFQDTYFTFPENGIVLYWPEFPDWAKAAKHDLNILAEEYHLVSTPEKNPQRKTAWTGLFYDKVSKIWMVTAATPIYIQDKYIATVHHDVMVNEILNRTMQKRLDASENYFIVRGDGRLILHPQHQDDIQKNEGQFDIANSKDEVLKSQFKQIIHMSDKSDVIESEDGKYYLAVAKIEGPDWYLVTAYPKKIAQSQAANNSAFILIAGLLSLLLEVLILFFVLKKQISEPLIELIQASNEIAKGKWHTPTDLHRKDELGELANSFNHMAVAIQERDHKLEVHAQDLENLVAERTRELDEQKLINMQASKMLALGEMAGGIAHEINTPLATIKLLTSQLINEIKNDIPDLDNLAIQVQKIENTADRVAKIVRGLRTFARDGSSDPLDQCSAEYIMNEAFMLCSEQLRINNVALKLFLPEKDISLNCRGIQIAQVLLNLISNARDAIEDQKEKWIEVSVTENEEWVEFRVTDSGKGISKENQEKIFQPFFTTKGIGVGTGMGLSISLGIIKAHKGELFVDSTCANTCFVMRLARAHAVAA
jgi:two-component system NtrC family sensor kinase